ncbi:MAG TPA: hypothetical protein VHQ64_04285 [Pyrinomonadaceae bacterium]|nr:hypothetical protein [Pyrinomonadaceae bacterium]
MKKSILLLSGLGIGAGVLYALGSRASGQKKSNGSGKASSDPTAESENDRTFAGTSTGQRVNGKDSSKASSMAPPENAGSRSSETERTEPIDDQGTGQNEASEILKSIRDDAFESSNERLALALGRPAEEIDAWLSGTETIDGDVLMKARNLAMERGVNVEQHA